VRASKCRIGFLSTRLAGTDGVSLEAGKWRHVLRGLGHECVCLCGETDWPADKAWIVPEAHFEHPDVAAINGALFDEKNRTPELARRVFHLKEHLKDRLRAFVSETGVQLLVAENALSLPMNLPLGLAVAEYIAETSLPTVGHHHDFWWERTRYAGAPARDYLCAAFPPTLGAIQHVVINSVSARELSFRAGVGGIQIPNVMDFDSPPGPPDGYAADMREQLGIAQDDCLLLQPTRIVPRKRIERAIELAKRLQDRCVIVVSHEAGDEGREYHRYLHDLADLLGVRLLTCSERFDHRRGKAADGGKVYSIADAYQQADLVTYTSIVEGFGNAFLETVYYKRPVVMGAYEIFQLDIRPKGFQLIVFEEFIEERIVEEARRLLHEPATASAWVERNYELGRRFYSYRVLEKRLESLIGQCLGTD
jgi:glycosyltransferase involved in cell wall biosynthesis